MRQSYPKLSRIPIQNSPAVEIAVDALLLMETQRTHLETDLVAMLLSDPQWSMLIADQFGITAADFHHEDLRLIYLAADVLRKAPILDVLVLARRALQAEHFWNQNASIGLTGFSWSNETLAMLAESWPFSATRIQVAAKSLKAFNKREADIHRTLARLDRLLCGEPVPPDRTPVEPTIILRASRARGAA